MERWKKIPGYGGDYLISDTGKVKSRKYGRRRILKSAGKKYLFVRLCKLNSKPKNYRIHRLVAENFIPNPENKPCVNHLDGNKHNNHVENLEWCTDQENTDHAMESGLFDNSGVNSGVSKLTNDQVQRIRRSYKEGRVTHQDLANKYDISKSVITDIINRNIWRHLPEVTVEKMSARDRMKRRMHPGKCT